MTDVFAVEKFKELFLPMNWDGEEETAFLSGPMEGIGQHMTC